MDTYFVCRTISDGLQLEISKLSTVNKAKGLYDCEHTQNIEVSSTAERVWVRSDCKKN